MLDGHCKHAGGGVERAGGKVRRGENGGGRRGGNGGGGEGGEWVKGGGWREDGGGWGGIGVGGWSIDVINVFLRFYYFKKHVFNVFLFFECSLFSSGQYF